MQVIPYFTFAGNCEEALNFYQKALGGSVTIVNRYDNPAMGAPADYHNKVLHARLEFDGGAIYASDILPGKTTKGGSGDVSISLILHNLDKATSIFNSLADGGKIGVPFAKQFWGDYHGNMIDKYGFNWNINYEASK